MYSLNIAIAIDTALPFHYVACFQSTERSCSSLAIMIILDVNLEIINTLLADIVVERAKPTPDFVTTVDHLVQSL